MATQSWDLDISHSSIGFWVRHLVISKVHGRFTNWSGKLLFDEAAHHVAGVRDVNAVAEFPLEPIAVEQGHEELEILFLAVVRRGRHQ